MTPDASSHQPDAPMNDQLHQVVAYMSRHSLVLTTAESCTAGLIAAHLADVPGAGQLLECAYVVYSPEAKQHCLGVSSETIDRCNLTSEEVAREMAIGAMRRSQANLAISNTGVTDDTDPSIAPGTQCFAWLFASRDGLPERLFSETRQFSGERNAIREQAAVYALTQIAARHAQFTQPASSAKTEEPTS
jgi:nicotinamide-nucleotide amidase